MAYDAIVSGHLCADLLPETSNLPLNALASPGKLFEIGPLDISTGGSVSNTGLTLHRLGVDTGLMTTIGDDVLGQAMIARLNERDARLGELIAMRPQEASSYSIILSPENADRIILHCAGNNTRFDLSDVDFDTVRTAKMFHLGYPPLLPRLYANEGESLMTIFRRVHEMGVLTSLDMAHPDPGAPAGQVNWARVLERVLPYVDIFLPSVEEIVFMLRRADYDRWEGDVLNHISRGYLRDLTAELLDMGVVIAGCKLGVNGFYLRTSDADDRFARLQRIRDDGRRWRGLDLWHPTFQVEVVGTVGAGDCAYGGFLAALLRGLGPEEALRFTCAVGASNVESIDATSGVRSWEETLSRLQSGWPVHSYVLPD